MIKENKKLLDQVTKMKDDRGAALIAPLDNLLWDRKTIGRIFDFNYTWEVYKPKAKRDYGYYVLPILFGDRFVGRLDPGYDKKARVLTINNWLWEKNVKPDQELADALKTCLTDFINYLGAEELNYSKTLLKIGGMDWLQEI